MLISDLCDSSDSYIAAKVRINVTDNTDANRRNKKLPFKNNASFRTSIAKI